MPYYTRSFLAGTATFALILGGVGTAQADTEVPAHIEATGVTLLGASPSGVAVQQDAAAGGQSVVHTGAWGSTLTARPQIPGALGSRERFISGEVTGDQLSWGIASSGSASSSTLLHRTDLLTGRTTVDGRASGTDFSLLGATAWVASPDPFSTYPLPSPALQVLPVPTAPGKDSSAWTGKTSLYAPTPMASMAGWDADATTAVAAVRNYLPGDKSFSPTGDLQLLQIPLSIGLPSTLLTGGKTGLVDLALGSRTVAWATKDAAGTTTVSSMPRTGGTAASRVESDAKAMLDELVVADNGTVGYLVPAEGNSVSLRMVSGNSATDVQLPVGSSGLAAVGNDFVTATGLGSAPGVYRIAPGGAPVPAASIPVAEFPMNAWSLNSGKIYYADRSQGSGRSLALWARPVSAQAQLGDESLLDTPAGGLPDAENALPISFSGARGLVASNRYNLQWDLLDRDRRTTSLEQSPVRRKNRSVLVDPDPQVSGPYALLAGQVFRANGELLQTLPAAARLAEQDDLFGSQVLYGTTAKKRAQVWLSNSENRKQRKLFEQTCARAPEVSLWGRKAAWTNCSRTQASVRDLVTGKTRSVATGKATTNLTLGEGALAWTNSGRAAVLDLSSATSTPTTLPGTTRSLVLDSGLVGRSLAGPANLDLAVSALPFEVVSHPRLTGRISMLGFTPNGDGKRDTWAPQFDTTEPLAEATLQIVSERSGNAIRTLRTTDTADGGIRDLVWDGKSSSGDKAAVGYYRWNLTARSASGAALTTATDGKKISGRIELGR
ncbi:FlgD immunoglobulin-like domain containing protein [Kineosporia babensis]|uniref:FlgD/Vpr Ig-like domain-containing protein n=1 Tax=Kineosporia babensis TaxID=499548 RepID=A0A9X1NHB7_9ACTN|nr:hypothetical protein [Kineosporia babensis]